MSRLDEMRLMAKVARMYYDQGIRQQEITERLNIHQSKVSRMLKRAREANIVRISVTTPAGFFPELEDALERRFQLKEAVVIDSDGGRRAHRTRPWRCRGLLSGDHDQARRWLSASLPGADHCSRWWKLFIPATAVAAVRSCRFSAA